MRRNTTWRVTAIAAAAAIGAAGLLLAQAPAPAAGSTVTFRLFAFGREVGRETSTLSASGAGRKIDSVVAFKDRGADVRLTASIESDIDWEPKRVVLKGQPFAGATADLEVTAAGTQATVRDRGASTTVNIGNGLFFPIDGPTPVALQESLVAYWQTHGRPASIPSAPGGAIRIQRRADEQVDIAGRTYSLQRLTIDGPVWGRQTAWVEPGGNLAALVTWLDGVPFQAVRDGLESRLARFVERALRDRMEDLEGFTVAPEHGAGVVLTGATVIPSGGKPVIPDAVVVVREGRIAAVGPASRVKAPEDLPKVDVSGMTIVPGLWDADARLAQIEFGPLHLAAGITTVRSVSTDYEFATALRAAMADREGRFLGPRLIPAGLIEGADGAGPVRVGTVEEAREAARKYRNEGHRRLDLGNSLPPVAFRTAVAEGRRLGMGVGASLPPGIALAEAIESGVDLLIGIPAGEPSSWMPLLTRQQVALAPELAATDGPFRAVQMPGSLARRLAVAGSANSVNRAARMAAVRAARDARVSILGGTGIGAPAIGLWRELELLVEAGLTPEEALQAVTSTAARVLKTDDAGVIESGKRADLLVLTGNPMSDIANIRTGKWVVAGGKMYEVEKLRRLVN
jgi:hypothetical protein